MKLSFRLFVEESAQERNVRKEFLRRLGFNPNKALDDPSVSTIKVRSWTKDIFKALDSLGIDEDTVEQLKNWVKTNKESTLQQLINQISPNDVPDEKSTGTKAILPKGQPKPEIPQNPDASPQIQMPMS